MLSLRRASSRWRPASRLLSTSPADLAAENARLRAELSALRDAAAANGAGGVAGAAAAAAAERTLFVGARSSYTSQLRFWCPEEGPPPSPMPCFRLVDDLGEVVPGAEAHVPQLDEEVCLRMMETMLRVSEFDKVFNDAQRQGRISFYLTSRGEEACSVGSAAALREDDWMLPQYRELGSALWRGMTYTDIANQATGNRHDPAHGRQLPLHYGSYERRIAYVKSTVGTQCEASLNSLGTFSPRIVYVKSTLGTQCPHAAGVGYGMKRRDYPRLPEITRDYPRQASGTA